MTLVARLIRTNARRFTGGPYPSPFQGVSMADRPTSRPYRVVQWTTGNVGQRCVVATVANPQLELVGCYAWSPDKVGRDVGELAGIAPIGVSATDDKAALLALRPDCVIYTPKWPDVDELAG